MPMDGSRVVPSLNDFEGGSGIAKLGPDAMLGHFRACAGAFFSRQRLFRPALRAGQRAAVPGPAVGPPGAVLEAQKG